MELNIDQKAALELFKKSRENILLIGAAGTGKSVLVREICNYLYHEKIEYAVTAMTGVAADLIRGSTLHKALGLQLAPSYDDTLKSATWKQAIWQKLQVLIVDEISMLDGVLLDWIEQIGRILRNNESPFGGLRLVFCGDPLQLGPVKAKKLFFEAYCFERLFRVRIDLTLVMRQNGGEYLDLLQRMRLGKIGQAPMSTLGDLSEASCQEVLDLKLLLTRAISAEKAKEADLMRLFCKNVQVDAINKQRIDRLIANGAIPMVLKSVVKCDAEYNDYAHLLKPDITICVGAKVMHTRNIKPLVNGSQGKVIQLDPLLIDFGRVGICHVCATDDDFEIRKGSRKIRVNVIRVPLILAYALTVHKAQGATIDEGVVDLADAFNYGQTYTALSRFRSIDGLHIQSFKRSCVKVCPKSLAFVNKE